ncbi:hypothetical protein BDZ90DRAFT_230850 [Jaminaea rosea]|uniref:Uncharacterized protein n=1 Tax=Jaminaea rosea TaxID=1569628 RepID=A0A316UU60_9BASI|nr:hypothetical protein BDZ90DRAFT_230850 [Jaminaea rosea]PWN28840.1 hypothetical protein BDZ90DRAFT_230850 [Jaminaea rosea]
MSLFKSTSSLAARTTTALRLNAAGSSSITANATLSARAFSSSSAPCSSWGGGKLKTHQGAAKRFRPLSKRRPRYDSNPASIIAQLASYSAQNGGTMSSIDYALAAEQMGSQGRGEMRPGPLFKRGKAGKRHLNLQVNGSRLNSLGGTAVAGRGRTGWHLRKLLAPIV